MIILETGIGPALLMHRLALALECIDSVTERPVRSGVRIGREVRGPQIGREQDAGWPCVDLLDKGVGRGVLTFGQPLPDVVTIRIADPTRHAVPRRLSIPLWPAPDGANAALAAVPAASRSARPWLLPGSAYLLPPGATSVRGTLVRGGSALRWARITARGPGGMVVGRAHADDRGEFLLVISSTGTLPPPAPSELDITLEIHAGPQAAAAADNLGDLPIERLIMPAAPPDPGDLLNDTIRGRTTPPGYTGSIPLGPYTVPIGSQFSLSTRVVFP
ncbi:hypothetical protein ASG92_22290 [Arthrobacter sp. Soil736]|uniref:hypothetical protein n=1 Tax=Arthrobacter sp. Soil736 TaxID=1736395 RepID=UPI0006F72000|nr:hypothetical protein [Arthrobacter sp. Soil736]KRE60016.1 hypothetical protein ASG92_22290 [Arthrobacter sp. Soil736]